MNVQSIELMGPEYILMLGVWWGVAVILTFVFLTAKRAYVTWRRQASDGMSVPAASGHVDV